MKKLLLPICLIVIGTMTARSQSFSIGARAGLNFASISESGYSSNVSYSTRTSFLLGGYATIMFNDKMGLQPELLYSSVGGVDKSSSTSTTLKLDYISVPVFFRYSVNDNFHLLAGPQLGILASAKAVQGGTTVDFKDFVNSSDFGAAIGVGVDFGPFNAGLRYYAGLSNVAKNSGGTDKNNGLQLVAGYRFFKK